MTGGGFGGCVLALVDADRADAVAAAVPRRSPSAGFTAPGTAHRSPRQPCATPPAVGYG